MGCLGIFVWAAALLGPAGPATVEGCPLVVVVDGADELQRALVTQLDQRGIEHVPRPGCPAASVVAARLPEGITLDIADADGRRTRRVLSALDAAASVIEAWTRPGLLVHFLRGAEGQPASQPHEVVGSAPVVADSPAAAEVSASAGGGRSLAVASEAAAGSDDSTWFGLSVSGCAAVGPLCVGTVARLQRDLGAREDRGDVLRRRNAVELLLSAELPLRVGPIRLRPGVGLGLGWVHMRLDDAVVGLEAQGREVNRGGLRAAGSLAASLPVAGRWSLQLATGIGVSLFAHTDSFWAGGVSVPGEPRALLRGSVGVRYGEP
jgi:hypothetical protein